MKETPTDNLNTELMSPSHLDAYLKEHSDEFLSADIVELLERFYEGKQISKAELARRAGISEVYLHQVFSGRRTPSEIACSVCVWVWEWSWRRRRLC